MGNKSSFSAIQKKYKNDSVDYIVSKYQERKIYECMNDQIKKLKQNATVQQNQDLQFINEQKIILQNKFQQILKDVQAINPGEIQASSVKSKQTVQQFSGYNQTMRNLDTLQKNTQNQFEKQKILMEQNLRKQIKNYQSSSSLAKIPEYDNLPDNYKKNVQDQCIKKYPVKAQQMNLSQLKKKIEWNNYKQHFEKILNKETLKQQIQVAGTRIKQNLMPRTSSFC